MGLTSLEVYNSSFNIKEGNNKFEFYTDFVDECSFTKLKEELLIFSNISHEHPQDKI